MVDSVSNPGNRVRLHKVGTDATNTAGKGAQGSGNVAGTSPTTATDDVSLSQAAQTLPSGLDVGPPFDLELVSRIKKEIAEGRYPIDYERITDSLFESYRDIVN
ncbi:MAG: flagellar biosynthesis anti-sigma factor FlgM [Pseudomonadota bacterium]|nr:flagellar biosynthesis anti-sigma factor FlgM [Pseudomonadota bacterium]MEC8796523.1 flagellar biosynthesis anti-sigma factor FlgM [Pseudomonadota bacterium]